MSAISIIILLLFLPLFVFISIIWDYSFKNKGKFFHWLFGILLSSVFIVFLVYFLYPEIYSILNTSDTTSSLKEEKQIESKLTEEQKEDNHIVEPTQPDDDGTDKNDASNPESNQQTASTSQNQTTPEITPTEITEPETKPVSNTGQGKFLVVVISLPSRSAAEDYVSKLESEGFECEIVGAIVEGKQTYRVSVASFDDEKEAQKRRKELISELRFENAWIGRR